MRNTRDSIQNVSSLYSNLYQEDSHMSQNTSAKRTYLTSKQVSERYGGCSGMTLWRWQQNSSLNFPRPIKINTRRLWDIESLEQFDAERIADSGEAS